MRERQDLYSMPSFAEKQRRGNELRPCTIHFGRFPKRILCIQKKRKFSTGQKPVGNGTSNRITYTIAQVNLLTMETGEVA